MPRTSLFLTMYFAQFKKNDPRYFYQALYKTFWIHIYQFHYDIFSWHWLSLTLITTFWIMKVLDLKKTTVQDIFIKVLTKLFRYTSDSSSKHFSSIIYPFVTKFKLHKGVTLLWIFQTIKLYQDFYFLRHTTLKDGNLSVLLNFLYQSVWLNITILVQGLKYQISSRSQVWIRLAWGSCLDIMSKIF